MTIDRPDHLVLTVRDVEATCAFYARVLQMQPVRFGELRPEAKSLPDAGASDAVIRRDDTS